MLRVFKPSSPMSVGSWLLAAYGPAAGAAAFSAVTGILPAAGTAATAAAAALGPGMSTYTAALICNTAVPAWHNGYREMPYLFAGSAASAQAAWVCSRPVCAGGARAQARGAWRRGRDHLRAAADPADRRDGRALQVRHGRFMLHASEVATACALAVAFVGRRHRRPPRWPDHPCSRHPPPTRFAIFGAGRISARDPKYTIVPQRERLTASPSAEPSPALHSAAGNAAAGNGAAGEGTAQP